MRKLLTLLCVLLIMGTQAFAQRNCATNDYHEQQLLENPEYRQNQERLEQFTQQWIREHDSRELNGTVIKIPVIVHVVYQNSTENISNAQIASQIQVLNDDFRRTNSDASNTPSLFQGVAADTEIEFCLINTIRVSTTVNSFGTNNSVKFASSGGSDVVTPSSAMNIWVCEIGGGILGYAQFPGGSASTDGVVCDYRYFGTTGTATAPFDLGRTATHEVGHYLNLRHIWGDGACNVDDQVSDTPAAGGPNYTGAPCSFPGPNSCKPKGKPGQPDDPDMFQNYMDYSDDVCMNLYTLGQKTRMMAALNGSRPGLISASCSGTPVEICNNGIDDDNDGAVDCLDGDCASDPICNPTAENCTNGVDDDGDGDIDCADGDCATDPACTGSCDDPTNLSHTRQKGGREALLQWNAVSGAIGYYVEVYNGNFSSLHASGTVTSNGATVGGLTKNAPYSWKVQANCSSGATSNFSTGTFNARVSGSSLFASGIPLFAYPNPSDQDEVTLVWDLGAALGTGIYPMDTETEATSSDIRIELYDLSGKVHLMTATENVGKQMTLDISGLEAGMYIVRVTNADGVSANVKFVRN